MLRKGLSLVTVLALLLCCVAEGKFALVFFHDDDATHALEVVDGQAVLHHGEFVSEPSIGAFSDHHDADHDLDCGCSTLASSPAGFQLPAFLSSIWQVVPTAGSTVQRQLAQASESTRPHAAPTFLRHQALLI